jgi:hypothetical protein
LNRNVLLIKNSLYSSELAVDDETSLFSIIFKTFILTFLRIGMFTTSDDDWQSYVPRIFPSRVWRNFRNRRQGRLCYVILISPAISYCDFVCYAKVTCFNSVV